MINIVFLLLVFFMLTATIAPPDPLQVQPPVARGAAATEGREVTLHVGADGALMIGDARAEAALAALAALPDGTALRVNADAGLDGAAFARLLGRLAAAGVTELSVVVAAP
ncbi:ExbD/TolR family protein [Rhodobaculum claviforme]|nr:biopolymer transporter ExbD [Rhodobaculum claviforme]